MSFGRRVGFSFAVALILSGPSLAGAQDRSWGDLKVSFAHLDYDLSGTGNTAGLAVRTNYDFSSNVRLEFGALYAKPEHQFVGPSTLFAPEAQLQYRWNLGRFSPYVGGGIGASLVKSDFHSNWDPTLSVAGGTAVRLTDRVALTGELRLRAHKWKGAGSTAEISTGLAWRLPSF
jgi:opacity protein-like surface antigen